MAENKDPNGTMNLGELSTIRNILMGQQMNEYDSRFAELEKILAESEERANQKMIAMEEKHIMQIQNLQAEMSARFEKLENILMENVSKINERMETTSREDKHQLGQFLADVSKKLMDA